jgi:hypothetical protein
MNKQVFVAGVPRLQINHAANMRRMQRGGRGGRWSACGGEKEGKHLRDDVMLLLQSVVLGIMLLCLIPFFGIQM